MSRCEIRLSGSGGQGMITAGIILAAAAAIYENKNAVQSQSYGPEARGGSSKAEVVISDDEINFPKITAPDILVALTQEAYEKYSSDLKKGGTLIVDSTLVPKIKSENVTVHSLPLLETVTGQLGKSLALNIATIGALNAACRVVSEKALMEAVLSMIPKGTEEFNKKALEIGYSLVGKK